MSHLNAPPDHRSPAVARVDIGRLRRIEAALRGCETCRAWAQDEISFLIETAEWRARALPPAEDRSAA